MSLINVVILTDIRCICAQFTDILRDRGVAYHNFLKAQNDDAQKLLDLLQDVIMFLTSNITPQVTPY